MSGDYTIFHPTLHLLLTLGQCIERLTLKDHTKEVEVHLTWLGIRGTQVNSSIQDIVDEVATIKKAPLWG